MPPPSRLSTLSPGGRAHMSASALCVFEIVGDAAGDAVGDGELLLRMLVIELERTLAECIACSCTTSSITETSVTILARYVESIIQN